MPVIVDRTETNLYSLMDQSQPGLANEWKN